MSAFQLSPFGACFSWSLFDSLACGTVLNMLSQSRLSESDLADRIDCEQGRIPRGRSGTLDRADHGPHRSLVLLERTTVLQGGLVALVLSHPKPRMGPLRSQWAPVGGSGAQLPNMSSNRRALFLSLASLLAVKKHESLKNTKIL